MWVVIPVWQGHCSPYHIIETCRWVSLQGPSKTPPTVSYTHKGINPIHKSSRPQGPLPSCATQITMIKTKLSNTNYLARPRAHFGLMIVILSPITCFANWSLNPREELHKPKKSKSIASNHHTTRFVLLGFANITIIIDVTHLLRRSRTSLLLSQEFI